MYQPLHHPLCHTYVTAAGMHASQQAKSDLEADMRAGAATPESAMRDAATIHAGEQAAGTMGLSMAMMMMCCYFPLTVFTTVWFILGNIWFWKYSDKDTCEPALYDTAFVSLMYSYAMLLLGCVVGPGMDPSIEDGYEPIMSDYKVRD